MQVPNQAEARGEAMSTVVMHAVASVDGYIADENDEVAAALAEARRRAGAGAVALCAGKVGGQAFALSLGDEVARDLAAVVFDKGKGYFGHLDGQHLL